MKKKYNWGEYRNPGPYYQWHIDDHDKSRTFGFPVSGCIDGFPRILTWLGQNT